MEMRCFCSHLLKILCQFLVPTIKNKDGNKTLLVYLCVLNYYNLCQWYCFLFTLVWKENKGVVLCISWYILLFNINICLITNSFSSVKFSLLLKPEEDFFKLCFLEASIWYDKLHFNREVLENVVYFHCFILFLVIIQGSILLSSRQEDNTFIIQLN